METITINPATTASFDVDAQKTFTPICPSELPVDGGDRIADALNDQANLAAYRIGSKDAHPTNPVWLTRDPSQIGAATGIATAPEHWVEHAVPGTTGFALLDGLPQPQDYDFFVYKGLERDQHPYGACYHDVAESQTTGIIEFLAMAGVDTVVVGGLATDFCVAATARQLNQAGFHVILNRAATRGIDPDGCEQAMADLERRGVFVLNDANDQARVDGR